MFKIKQLTDKFGFIYGGVAGVIYSTSSGQTTTTEFSQTGNYNTPYSYNLVVKNNSQNIQPYAGFVLGAVYKINASFLLYAEIDPNIYYAHTNTSARTTNTNTTQLPSTNFSNENTSNKNNTIGISGLSNSGAMLTLVYRITK